MARRFTDPGRLFESAPVAQWIEQPASNRQAEGSIPSGGASGGASIEEPPAHPLVTVARKVASNGMISVSGQVFSVGVTQAGKLVTVHVEDDRLHVWCNGAWVRTVLRTSRGEVRKKNAAGANDQVPSRQRPNVGRG
jgi:hypothetical protein